MGGHQDLMLFGVDHLLEICKISTNGLSEDFWHEFLYGNVCKTL